MCATVLWLLAGCASVGSDTEAASQVVLAFYSATASGNGAVACVLLAPGTLAELVDSADKPCAQAVLALDLPSAGAVRQTQTFGTAAQVVMDGDVVFLTDSGGSWQVTAAGCTARGDQPYRCTISGG